MSDFYGFVVELESSSPVSKTGTNNSSWVVFNSSKLRRVRIGGRGLSRRLCLRTGNGGFRESSNGIRDKDGIVIVDHGSRRKESNLMLSKLHDNL